MRMDAYISEDGIYRYILERDWGGNGGVQTWVMLNPSTADAFVNDPTITRIMARARSDGFGSIRVVNLFGLRSTDPKLLKTHKDPIGPENNVFILDAIENANQVVCAWGNHGSFNIRDEEFLALVDGAVKDLYVLGISKKGQPIHPLYVPMSIKPQIWRL